MQLRRRQTLFIEGFMLGSYKTTLLNLFLIVSFLVLTSSKVLGIDSLANDKPLIIGPYISCNFQITFHHLDSSSVYYCPVIGPKPMYFCDHSDEFTITIWDCRISPEFWSHFIGNPNNYGLFYLGGDLLNGNGYSYSGFFLHSSGDNASYFRQLEINGWELNLRYSFTIPKHFTFMDLYNYCTFLHESIEVVYKSLL